MPRAGCLTAIASLLLIAADLRANDFFEKKIRPVLAEHCYSCHSAPARAKGKLKASLLVDSRSGLLKGGDSGPAVVPGKAEESLLVKALRYRDDLRMPPRRKLPDAVIADFVIWINQGAPAPEAAASVDPRRTIDLAEGRKFWAYRPVRKPTVPAVRDVTWPANDIDRFVLARLEARGLSPAANADRDTLVRRLHFDLLGLPPTPEELESARNDRSPHWYEKRVDALLASPHFGERWGRHWLDVARFGESLTLRGFILKEAWRYRDYVIDAFNDDVPFDRFIREQIAGDLLPAATPADRRRQLVAVAFLALGNTNLEEQDKQQLRMDVVDEQLDTISRAFLAQTIGCARCHDHKFDPIPTRDYYALAGILRNTQTLEHANVSRWLEAPLPADAEEEAVLRRHEAQVAALQKRIKAARAFVGPPATGDVPLHRLEQELKQLQARGPKRRMALTVREEKRIEDARVHIRGSVHHLGASVPRGFLQVATPGVMPKMPATESGRTELARWLADKENPLPARVLVNRAWHWLFGAGIVRTTDNFGRTGEAPSHPELLDYLAARFVEDGWSVKRLVRRLVLSRTYRLSAVADCGSRIADSPNPQSVDPENRLLGRANRRRLDAECIRDTMLSVSGRLQLDRGGLTFPADLKADYGYRHTDRRRSVYAPVFRNALPELFEVFDFADPSIATGCRNVSTVAPQALFLMNHPFVREQARFAARRLLAEPGSEDRTVRAYRLALGRLPSEVERRIAVKFLGAGSEEAWATFFQALFASIDFRYVN